VPGVHWACPDTLQAVHKEGEVCVCVQGGGGQGVGVGCDMLLHVMHMPRRTCCTVHASNTRAAKAATHASTAQLLHMLTEHTCMCSHDRPCTSVQSGVVSVFWETLGFGECILGTSKNITTPGSSLWASVVVSWYHCRSAGVTAVIWGALSPTPQHLLEIS
jgi:hypothetical protein